MVAGGGTGRLKRCTTYIRTVDIADTLPLFWNPNHLTLRSKHTKKYPLHHIPIPGLFKNCSRRAKPKRLHPVIIMETQKSDLAIIGAGTFNPLILLLYSLLFSSEFSAANQNSFVHDRLARSRGRQISTRPRSHRQSSRSGFCGLSGGCLGRGTPISSTQDEQLTGIIRIWRLSHERKHSWFSHARSAYIRESDA